MRLYISFAATILALLVLPGVSAQNKVIINTGEGAFPLWWSAIAYVLGFLKLAYIFYGLLAIFVYRHWVYRSEPDYAGFKNYEYGHPIAMHRRSAGNNVDEIIKNFGAKYNQ